MSSSKVSSGLQATLQVCDMTQKELLSDSPDCTHQSPRLRQELRCLDSAGLTHKPRCHSTQTRKSHPSILASEANRRRIREHTEPKTDCKPQEQICKASDSESNGALFALPVFDL
jgi:hypothetical protein